MKPTDAVNAYFGTSPRPKPVLHGRDKLAAQMLDAYMEEQDAIMARMDAEVARINAAYGHAFAEMREADARLERAKMENKIRHHENIEVIWEYGT